jgi:hypothetical protein
VKTGIQDPKKISGFLLEFIPMNVGAGMTDLKNSNDFRLISTLSA